VTNPEQSPFADLNAETIVHIPKETLECSPAGEPTSVSSVLATHQAEISRGKSAAEFNPGDVLAGRYRITKLLGEGGMGAVYKALDTELDRPVALKLIRPELASQPELILRFKNELILARQITHRNVVRIFDISVSEGNKFMTMEFVEGVDLYHLLAERGKLPVEEAIGIFRQALLGLQAAHNEGVVHRDLKPHNILVDPQGRAVLMDFGIASSAETSGMTRTGMLMGTPYYMAPEQALGRKADARSDLFSMGVIFFEMLTGTPPYQATSSIQTLIKRTTGKAPSVREFEPEIPEYIAGIVARCLEIDLDRRYPSAAAILADLDAREASRPGETRYGTSATELLTLQPGSLFGTRYRIESVLGQGGMGTVYKASDLELDRPVALKLVRAELANKPASFERLKQEILLASSISHRNILRIHDLGEVDGLKFISMAYVDGPDLAALLRSEGTLSVDRALGYAVQICEALQAAHAESIVHRDLKPQNILVGKDDRAFITDFGVAVSLAAEGIAEAFGTPEYMAPEQVEGTAVDSRADLYSFGLILYQMVAGALPFQAETAIQTLFQRVTQPPRNPKLLNPDLPDALVSLILKCLERDPQQRYQTAAEILEELRRIQQAHPVAAQPVTTPVTVLPQATPKSHRARWIAAACTAALLVSAGAIPQSRNRILALLGRPSKANPVVARYVAVIPMRVPGDDPALSLLADGIVDTLSTRLGQLSGVHLASPAAAARVNPRDPLTGIAHSLGAKLIVQGEVSGAGDKVEIAITINEPDTGRRVWTHAFSGLRQDILTIQDQIFQQTAAAMDLKLSSEDLARGVTHPTEDVGAYSIYLSGRNLLAGKRDQKTLTKALELFQSAIEKDPNFALAYTGLADASRYMYELTKDGVWTNRALGAATHAQQLNDSLPEVHFALGSIYDATGKTAEAIAELNRALQLAPNSDEAYRRIGRAYSNAGRKEEAMASFQKAIDTNPYYWLNYNLLGIALVQSGDNQRALQAFQKVTEVDPGRDSGWSNIGFIYHNLGKWEESMAMYKKAVELQPSAANYTRLGVSVFSLGHCEEAKTYYDKALALNPSQLTFYNLADAYRCLNQKTEATKYYQLAIDRALRNLQVNPKDATTLSLLGLYYAKKGDAVRGREFARRARSLDPKDVQILYQSAVAAALGGDKRESLDLLAQAIQKGYSRMEAANDRDLNSISADPEFKKLIQ
jgi:serine/threonine protein kinase/tetratricopeptide (TPR) repeat protein